MKIKSLEIVGFKTFYDKSKISFHPRINAIVGPNGCGKSNVIDAIRWVLGEQNPRVLRAEGGMEELIFNGSENLKPLGMVEVSLVIDDLPIADSREIEIKRRFFRSGESEYFLNATRCRLKDIRELFMDIGAGAQTYSIISQGKVDEFITAKPEDKRRLIEDVAGIAKYKMRRKETQSRLEYTKQNLSRISDMKKEVETRMEILRKQAKEAEDFRSLSQQVRELEIRILLAKKKEIEKKLISLSDHKTRIESEISSLRDKKSGFVTKLDYYGRELSRIEEVRDKVELDVFDLKSALQKKSSFHEYALKEISGIDSYVAKLKEEIYALTSEKQMVLEDIENKKRNLENINEKLKEIELSFEKVQSQLKEIEGESSKKEKKLQSVKDGLFSIISKREVSKTSLDNLEKQLKELIWKRDRFEEEIKQLSDNSDSLIKRKNEIEENISTVEDAKRILAEKRSFIKNRYDDLQEKRKKNEEEVTILRNTVDKLRSRMEALQQIQQSYEWLPEATRNFLQKNKGNGVLGVLSDFITVPKRFEKAMEAVLSDKINWVIVKGYEEAVSAVQSFRKSFSGRGTFLPLKSETYPQREKFEDLEKPAISELIEVEGIDRSLVDFLFQRVFVVSDLKEAFKLKEQIGDYVSFVTPEGDYLDHSGAVSGGTGSIGIFERKSEIKELEKEIGEKEKKIVELENKLDVVRQEIQDIQRELSFFENSIQEKEITLIGLKKDLRDTISSIEENARKIDHIKSEIEKLSKEISYKEDLVRKLALDLGELEKKERDLNSKLAEMRDEVREVESQVTFLEREKAVLNVEKMSLEERKKSVEDTLSQLVLRARSIDSKISKESEEIAKKLEEKEKLTASVSNYAEEVDVISSALNEKERILAEAKDKRLEYKKKTSELEELLAQLEKNINDSKEKLSKVELRLSNVQIELEHVEKSLSELNDGTGSVGVFYEDEDFEHFDLLEAQKKFSELKKRIDRFGPVNLLAPKEYQELEERFNFLNEQIEDLERAIDSLKKAIKKLDKESASRFIKAFEVVNEKFGKTFERLFDGGEGKLILIDPEDVLQSGVEVMVKPKGKRYQSLNLLSGGEKALTAIALILSACLVKPAPFLLLDEIDAPLDESNTVRFSKLLKEIAENSQVIIITHNKITMQAADNLVGVTSRQSSISTVVSVDLNEYQKV